MKFKSILKKLFRKITRDIINNQFFWNPPFNYVENITLNNICDYLEIRKNELDRWCIVGVCMGNEIPNILKKFPRVKVDGFECSFRYIERLKKRFGNNPRVNILNYAVSSSIGEQTFFETNLKGSGSLLQVDKLSQKSYGTSQKEKFTVETTTLDNFYKNKKLDVLWIDVQGAEMFVLDGAKEVLKVVKAIFIEISIKKGLYKNSVLMEEIDSTLKNNGFKLILLGTDINLTGNALYIRS